MMQERERRCANVSTISGRAVVTDVNIAKGYHRVRFLGTPVLY